MSIIKVRDIDLMGGNLTVGTIKAAGILSVTSRVSSVTATDGVSSVIDNALSDYTVNMDANLFNTSYVFSSGVSQVHSTGITNLKLLSDTNYGQPTLKTTSAMRLAYYASSSREPKESYFTVINTSTTA